MTIAFGSRMVYWQAEVARGCWRLRKPMRDLNQTRLASIKEMNA
jgi:hypothetical protein